MTLILINEHDWDVFDLLVIKRRIMIICMNNQLTFRKKFMEMINHVGSISVIGRYIIV